jgi:integrase
MVQVARVGEVVELGTILTTALDTGMSEGEILSLTLNNVDFDNNLFIINASNNKSKKV